MGILQIKKNIILYSITVFCTIPWVQSCKKTPAKPASQPQVNRVLDTQEVVKKQDPTTPNVSQQQEFSEWPNYPILDIAIKNLENGNPTFFKQPIEDIGNGMKRQLMGFNNQIMMAKIWFEEGAIGRSLLMSPFNQSFT